AHVVFPAFEPDPDTPATLSHSVLTGLLRDEMGFAGVVFTDCLEMAAIASGIGVVAGALKSIEAGADIVLVSHTQTKQRETVLALQAQLANGVLSIERVQQSLTRIAQIKRQLAIRDWRDITFDEQALRQPESLALAEKIQNHALQVVGEFQPLDLKLSVLLITVEIRTRTEIDEVALGKSHAARGSLLPLLLAAGCCVNEYIVAPPPSAEEMAEVVALARMSKQVVLQSYNACLSVGQQQLIAQLPMERLWLVAGRLPYDVNLAPLAQGRLAAFSNRPAALKSVAEKLIGL
ncbi:MAG: glycoside hydrolase family 3 N-terminal domain-containing protein, partial [Deefgea sp.]